MLALILKYAVASAPSYLTADEFERIYSQEKPYFEYWYGEAIQKPMAPLLHSYLQLILGTMLRSFGWRAGTETTLRISPLAYPIPDLIADPHLIQGPYPTKPIALCVEILSPSDHLEKVVRKAAHYLDWGIGQVWIIDAENRRAFVMSREHPAPVEVAMHESLIAGSDPSIAVPLGELFAEADRLLDPSH